MGDGLETLIDNFNAKAQARAQQGLLAIVPYKISSAILLALIKQALPKVGRGTQTSLSPDPPPALVSKTYHMSFCKTHKRTLWHGG